MKETKSREQRYILYTIAMCICRNSVGWALGIYSVRIYIVVARGAFVYLYTFGSNRLMVLDGYIKGHR